MTIKQMSPQFMIELGIPATKKKEVVAYITSDDSMKGRQFSWNGTVLTIWHFYTEPAAQLVLDDLLNLIRNEDACYELA